MVYSHTLNVYVETEVESFAKTCEIPCSVDCIQTPRTTQQMLWSMFCLSAAPEDGLKVVKDYVFDKPAVLDTPDVTARFTVADGVFTLSMTDGHNVTTVHKNIKH